MAETALPYRWTQAEFLRAWEAGSFDNRAELIDGEVWSVPIGQWHGDTSIGIARMLPDGRFRVTAASLPAGDSLPDPDCWVRPVGAVPREMLSRRMAAWAPEDVLLVVEVADETVALDLGPKARLYGSAGYAVYWVVTRDAIYEHTEPTAHGYRLRATYSRGETIPVRHADLVLPVDHLLEP